MQSIFMLRRININKNTAVKKELYIKHVTEDTKLSGNFDPFLGWYADKCK